ncbi:uncharacterized protein LOC132381625 isoform X4 [Hypanus sabinus]|uniref:uncharacterized protein LOC132381625 isoform X4 n=1 Tax=Hypanus sabinus TaxID=79690 RepID=UPI0028C4824F|nr:uncharacterized protein LOC132381625 isoform X4 [Hypanus sabinus]
MKCFERLVLSHIKVTIPTILDSHQFAYKANKSAEDAISFALHTVLTHLEGKGRYMRMLFVDYHSAFNTVIPSKLISKLHQLGLSSSLCNWVLNFLSELSQSVRLGPHLNSTTILNTGMLQGCILSPILWSLFAYNYVPVFNTNTIVKFTDDTTEIGLISNRDKSAYRTEVQNLVSWCSENNLSLNTAKTKELIINFGKSQDDEYAPVFINGDTVERVSSFRFLGIHISEDLTWSTNTTTIVKKAQQRLFFLRTLKTAGLPEQMLVTFNRCTLESI